MPLYERKPLDEELLEEEIDNELDDEEKNYKKRYGDLRRYQAKKDKEYTDQINELKLQIANISKQTLELPDNEDELEEWVKQYPDLARIIKNIALKEISSQREDVDRRIEEITKKEKSNSQEAAKLALEKLHPDFFDEIADDPEFADWLDTKSKKMQDALYEDLDVNAAADVITLYKYEKGLNNPKKSKKQNDEEAARSVNTQKRSAGPKVNKVYKFTESQIANMNEKEFEKNEEAIDEARRKGEVLYDISAAS